MKSGFPYLVDISVGNACPFGCPMCYTSSTVGGQYADGNFLGYVLSGILQKAGVFNVVFGGGEPTLYKSEGYTFNYILNNYHSKNFVIGVTTKNFNYHKKPGFNDEIQKIHSLAISCNSIEEVDAIEKLRDAVYQAGNGTCKVYVQSILGLQPWQNHQKLILKLKERFFTNITLLGYKKFGFGHAQKPFDIPDDWMNFVKDLEINIGIDSILVQQYRQKLIDRGVKNYYLVGREGESSCYVDALKKVVKPSSFTDVEYDLMKGLKSEYHLDEKRFLEIFRKF